MSKKVDDAILKQCEFVCDCSKFTEEEFAMSRRQGLGASDSSIYLGLQAKWRNTADLILNKLATTYTDEERAISQKPAVRKGKDLEAMILEKFTKLSGIKVEKPTNTYRLKEYPYLTVNFDGVGFYANTCIPVEAKFTTEKGDRYWDYTKATPFPIRKGMLDMAPYFTNSSIVAHCEEASQFYGVPPYYYSQVQQQIMGLDSPWGIITSLRDLDWTCYAFLIHSDAWLQLQIVSQGYFTWKDIERQQQRMRS